MIEGRRHLRKEESSESKVWVGFGFWLSTEIKLETFPTPVGHFFRPQLPYLHRKLYDGKSQAHISLIEICRMKCFSMIKTKEHYAGNIERWRRDIKLETPIFVY